MDDKAASLLRTAFDAYLGHRKRGGLEPSSSYLPYDFDRIDEHQWRGFSGWMVKDELREITNYLNHWQGSLQRWQAWNRVIDAYDTQIAHELRREFLESLAHHCLLQPSAVRDVFTFVATNAMHQVRLACDEGYRDSLEGDPKTPMDRSKYLTRQRKEKRLGDLISSWPEAGEFMATLRRVDDDAYREATSDYRNRASHAIGPRLGVGITQPVVRSFMQATQMTELRDGKYIQSPIPDRLAVVYGFGGTNPLDTERARSENLEQYLRARECYDKYRSVLNAGLSAMPPIGSYNGRFQV